MLGFDFEFNEPDMLCQDRHRDYTSIIVQPEKHSMPSDMYPKFWTHNFMN